jgi:hypothetical protein
VVEPAAETRQLAVALLAVAFPGLRDTAPAVALQAVVFQSAQSPGAPPQLTEVDRKFAEITKPGRQSEQIKVVPQLEQFIRDHPDYPHIERVYSTLLLVLMRAKTEPERLQALADDTLAKFTGDQGVRWTAYYVKFGALDPASQAFRDLGRHILSNEASILVLMNAADIDNADALPLLEKTIVERKKRPETTGGRTLDELQWASAGALATAGRSGEALRSSIEVVEATAKRLADLEPGAYDGFTRARADSLRETLADRCSQLVPRCEACLPTRARHRGWASDEARGPECTRRPRQLLLSDVTRLQCGVSASADAVRQIPVARVHDGGYPD